MNALIIISIAEFYCLIFLAQLYSKYSLLERFLSRDFVFQPGQTKQVSYPIAFQLP